ncbi:MAG: biotin/lipoyl-containing protein [Rhizobiaceae bacterium]
MKIRVKVPKLGLTIEEVTIATWEADEGATVEAEQVIATVEGDKANFEVVTPVGGTLLRRVVAIGDVVPIGGEIAVVETS